jgi:hypothetical protein
MGRSNAVGQIIERTSVHLADVEIATKLRARKRSSDQERLQTRLYSMVGSVFTCSVIYLVLFYLFKLATAMSASHFGMEPVLKLDRVVYLRGDLWYPHAVMHTYLLGTIMMGCVWMVSGVLLMVIRKSIVWIRHILVWVFVLSSAMVCQRLVGVIVEEPFPFKELGPLGFELNVYSTFAAYDMFDRSVMLFIGIVLAVLTGVGIARPFLATAPLQSDVSTRDRRRAFIRDRFVIPIVIATAFVTTVTYPASAISHMLCLLCVALIAVVLNIMAGLTAYVKIDRVSSIRNWMLWQVMVFAVVVLTIRTVLSEGVPF